jgi:hypothetical protein
MPPDNLICGSDKKTYESNCQVNKAACEQQTEILLGPSIACQGWLKYLISLKLKQYSKEHIVDRIFSYIGAKQFILI